MFSGVSLLVSHTLIRLFGVTSNFDQEKYTTKLEAKKLSKAQRETAERLANEIQSIKASNPHVAEERGQVTGTGDDDEEAKYGAVMGSGAYGSGTTAKTGDDGFTDSGIVKS